MEGLIVLVATKFHYLVVLGAALVWLYTKTKERKYLTLLGTLTLPTAFIVGKLASFLFASPRPFVAHDVAPLFAHAADNGFPSEHALFAFTIAALVYSVNKPVGLVLFILALMIGIARVMANVHHLIDIVGGAFLALLVVGGCQKIVKINILSRNPLHNT